MNGFAKVKNSANPMPIMATASTSAATMNILVCSCPDQLRLAGRAFEEAATQNAEADSRAERAHAEDDADGKYGHGLDVCNVLHSTLLTGKRSVN